MRTLVRWTLRGITAVVAAAGGWLMWVGASCLWIVAELLWPSGPSGTAFGLPFLIGAFFFVTGAIFSAVGLALLALAWSMSGLPRPTWLRGWFLHERFLRRSLHTFASTPDLEPGMSQRRISFEHDGHQFDAVEQAVPDDAVTGAPLTWAVSMDGEPVLDFTGGYPYRDPDVVKRVVEWYEIQRPRLGS